MRHVKIKIFGERNSSTNALRRLLEQNTQSRVLPSVAPELDPHFAERMKSMAQRPQANLLQESYVDSIFRTAKPQFSWKHGATHFASLDDFRDCLVIFALRHPASWLLALHRRPYHALQPVPSRFEDFLQAPWKTVERDNLAAQTLDPIRLYNAKAKSYLECYRRLRREGMDSAIVYFENFAENQVSVYKQLEKYLFKPISCPTIVKQSTKDQTRDAAFYSNYYGKALWRDELSPAAMETINTRVDWEVFSKFNYDPL